MKIDRIDFIPIHRPLDAPFRPAWSPNSVQTTAEGTVVKVESEEEGLVGFGWQNSFADEVRTVGKSKLVWNLLSAIEIEEIEKAVRILSGITYSLNTLDLWGIEVALWDIIGKSCGKSIHKILGGAQERVPAYASTAVVKSPREHAVDALKYREMGFRAIKIRLHNERLEEDVAVAKEVRDAVGSDMEIMVDANQACTFSGPIWSYERAHRTARELEKLDVFWLEEPLHHEFHDDLARLSSEVDMLIAGGEDECGLYRFREIIEHGCFDVLQPDTCTSGGILQLKKIASLAESNNKLLVPHAYDSGIDLAAALQVIGSIPNCPYVEYGIELSSFDLGRDGLLKSPIKISKDGFVEIPHGPGLGVEVNEEYVQKYRLS